MEQNSVRLERSSRRSTAAIQASLSFRGPILCAFRDPPPDELLALAALLAHEHDVQLAALGVARPLPFPATLFLNASRVTMERERREALLASALTSLESLLPDERERWGVYSMVGRWIETVSSYALGFDCDLLIVPAGTAEGGPADHQLARRLLPSARQPVLSVPAGTVAALPRRAMVGIDFGPDSALLVREAVTLLDPADASLLLVHVTPGESRQWSPEWREEYTAAASRHMTEWLDELGMDSSVRVESLVLDGDPVAHLRRLGAEHECDLVVIGSSGGDVTASRFRESAPPLGNVTDALLRDEEAMLLIVPSAAALAGGAREAASMPAVQLGAGMEIARVLVPLDGSAASEQALDFAADVARHTGAQVRLVHVRPPIVAAESSLHPEYPLELTDGHRFDGITVDARSLEGPVRQSLLSAAREWNADLMIMTSRGRGGLERAMLGSTADEVVRHSEIPVLLVRPREEPEDDEPKPGEEQRSLKRVLVPLDGTEAAERILPHVLALTGKKGVHYQLLRVQPPPVDGTRPSSGRIIGQRLGEEGDTYLSGVSAKLAELGVLTSIIAVEKLPTAQAIVRLAEDGEVDLVAMTTRGIGGMDRMLFGSVADQVLRNAPCSVLVLRPTEVRHAGIHAGASVLPAARSS